MIIRFFTGLVGAKFAMPAALVSAAILGSLIFGIILWSCSGDDAAEQQAEQTTASSEAIADSAQDAIEAIDANNDADAEIDEVVEVAEEEISNAKSADDVRDAVLDSLCGRPGFGNDPSCQLREPDSAVD